MSVFTRLQTSTSTTRSNSIGSGSEEAAVAIEKTQAELDEESTQETKKRQALGFLKQMSDRIKQDQLDGGRRVFSLWQGHVGLASTWVPLWNGAYQKGNQRLNNRLSCLQDIKLEGEEKKLSDEIFASISNNRATAKDIVRLYWLMNKVTIAKKAPLMAVTHSAQTLKPYVDQARNAGPDKAFAWSNAHANIVMHAKASGQSDKSAEEVEAGKWLANLFVPMVNQAKANGVLDQNAQDTIRYLMSLLKSGNMNSAQLVQLYEILNQSPQPNREARAELEHLATLADADRHSTTKVLTYQDSKKAFEFKDKSSTFEDDSFAKGAKKLRDSYDQLGIRDSALNTEMAELDEIESMMDRNNVRPKHILFLQNLLKRHDDPTLYALHELDRLYALSSKGDGMLTIRWDEATMKFGVAKSQIQEKSVLRNTGQKIAELLQPLVSLCDSKEEAHEVQQLLDEINIGEDVAHNLLRIKREFFDSIHDNHQSALIRDTVEHSQIQQPMMSALSELLKLYEQSSSEVPAHEAAIWRLNILRKQYPVDPTEQQSPLRPNKQRVPVGHALQAQLKILKSIVSRFYPEGLQLFNHTLDKIGRDIATPKDIEQLQALCGNALVHFETYLRGPAKELQEKLDDSVPMGVPLQGPAIQSELMRRQLTSHNDEPSQDSDSSGANSDDTPLPNDGNLDNHGKTSHTLKLMLNASTMNSDDNQPSPADIFDAVAKDARQGIEENEVDLDDSASTANFDVSSAAHSARPSLNTLGVKFPNIQQTMQSLEQDAKNRSKVGGPNNAINHTPQVSFNTMINSSELLRQWADDAGPVSESREQSMTNSQTQHDDNTNTLDTLDDSETGSGSESQ